MEGTGKSPWSKVRKLSCFAFRYTKVAAQKLTKTVIEKAIAGGRGIVDTLRLSYSMNDF